jgi:AcrR family transcriptional regulator
MTSAIPDPAPSRRERRRLELHEQIIGAATRLFEQKGFTATTALEVADAADVAEKTFYNHFATKQQLIAEIAQRRFAMMAEKIADARASTASTAEKLRLFCEVVADEAEKSRVFTREALFEVVRLAQANGVAEHRGFQRALQSLFQNGKPSADPAPDRTSIPAELGVAALIGILISWVTDANYPLRERLRQLADVASELISNRATAPSDEVRS